MRDHDDLPYIIIERRGAGAAPFFWGALIGAGAALLLAPRSGVQTQEELRQGVKRVRTAAEDRAAAARTSVARTRDRIEDRMDSVRGRFDETTERARDVLETGRRAARDARIDLERRTADARESFRAAADRVTGSEDRPTGGTSDLDMVVPEVAEERTEGRSDLG